LNRVEPLFNLLSSGSTVYTTVIEYETEECDELTKLVDLGNGDGSSSSIWLGIQVPYSGNLTKIELPQPDLSYIDRTEIFPATMSIGFNIEVEIYSSHRVEDILEPLSSLGIYKSTAAIALLDIYGYWGYVIPAEETHFSVYPDEDFHLDFNEIETLDRILFIRVRFVMVNDGAYWSSFWYDGGGYGPGHEEYDIESVAGDSADYVSPSYADDFDSFDKVTIIQDNGSYVSQDIPVIAHLNSSSEDLNPSTPPLIIEVPGTPSAWVSFFADYGVSIGAIVATAITGLIAAVRKLQRGDISGGTKELKDTFKRTKSKIDKLPKIRYKY
jgi:hypothetical protein